LLTGFILSLRPKQWTKNLLLFAGIIFAQRWHEMDLLLNVFCGFLIFCMLSGVVYITNDILDADKDREHPKKRFRPIASGRISPMAAGVGAALLLLASLTCAWLITPTFFYCAVIYVSLVTAYSFVLKHMVILDVMVLAMGFVVRAMAGIEALHVERLADDPVELRPFFVLTTLFLSLFLAIAKRRSELMTLGDHAAQHRSVLGQYSREFCDVLLTVATTGVIFSYAAWSTVGDISRIGQGGAGHGSYTMVLTMPFVLYGIFRYLWLVFRRDEGGAPEILLLTDRPLQVTVVLWLVTVFILLSV
jgi:4-hydroxybenzoate polyprenyltransferase